MAEPSITPPVTSFLLANMGPGALAATVLVEPHLIQIESPLLDALFSPGWLKYLRTLAAHGGDWRKQLHRAFVEREQSLPDLAQARVAPSPSPTYCPPLELLRAAEELLRGASPDELAATARAYVAYGSVTGGKSAVTGSELPDFDVCRPLVKAGWLAVVRELRPDVAEVQRTRTELVAVANSMNQEIAEAQQKLDALKQENLSTTTTLKVDVSGLEPQLEHLQRLADQLAPTVEGEGQIDPFLLGIEQIAAATRDLAEAQKALVFTNPHSPVADLIASVAGALHERVKALAPAEPEN